MILADARRIPLRDQTVQMVVTSPPYYGLRDYGVAGQIGLESSPEAYVATMVEVFREVRRVLKDDGVCWVNLGDSYGKRGELLGIPWMVAHAISNDGWLVQSEVIWSKPIGAPSGGSRRPLLSHEHIFLISKFAAFRYDADAIREPLSPATIERYRYSVKGLRSRGSDDATRKMLIPNKAGRYRRSVWTLAPTRYGGEHTATFPEEIVEPCILAGSRLGDLVFDPFIGSGTVGAVASRLGRRWVGTDLNPQYHELARKRTAQRGLMFV